jgi:hypothetical protein
LRVGILSFGGVLFALVLGTLLSTPASAVSSWSIQRAGVVASHSENDVLFGVSCVDPTRCIAVGERDGEFCGELCSIALVEAWNGARWSREPTPFLRQCGWLNSVSCPSVNSCFAVGVQGGAIDKPLVEAWNGSGWVVQVPPDSPAFELDSVSCSSASACTAVGTGGPGVGVAERWDGSRWQIQQTPSTAAISLGAVSCPSAASCTAVGNSAATGAPGVEPWDGTTWTVSPTPTFSGMGPLGISALSCAATTSCVTTWALGLASGAFAEHWNGSTWILRPLRLPSGTGWYPSGVSCVSATSCTVVGCGGAKWQWDQWDGRAWAVESMPTPAVSRERGLNAVSCLSAGACVAVGGPYAAVQSGMLVHVGHVTANLDGTIRYAVHVPGSGTLSVLETAWDDNLARAASLLRPAPHRFVVARVQAVSGGAGVVRLLVQPNARGRRLTSHHTYRVTLRAWITYTPRGGRRAASGYMVCIPASPTDSDGGFVASPLPVSSSLPRARRGFRLWP